MKEWLKDCFNDWIKSTEVYRQKEEETNDYNLECQRKEERIKKLRDDIKQCKAEKQECILSGQAIVEEKVLTIKNLKNVIANLESKLKEKEKQRRKSAGSIGGYKAKIKKQEEVIESLEKQVEFLKTNRRAPNIEELKDYFYRRKKKIKTEIQKKESVAK